VFPNFAPGFVYRWLAPFESQIEENRFGSAFCTVDMYGLTTTAAQ
jgi:hypothetical protein